jgi:NitT/TauT family transport system ATP-binding protein
MEGVAVSRPTLDDGPARSGAGTTGGGATPPPGPPVKISIRDSTKVFEQAKVVAFEHLSLDVYEQEALCIVGPSGCGKTTLLRCIHGLTPLSAGEILVGDRQVRGPDSHIAMVFQQFGLFPWMNVIDNIAYGLKVAGVRKAERVERARRYCTMVGLEGFEKSYPYQLSGGMQQRVGLARALTMEADVLLMDEPFASVDAQTRELLQEQLLAIWEQHPQTMVFITHSIEEAVLMGDRVAVLSTRPGRVKEVIDIPFGHPRKIADIFQDPRFGELRNEIWTKLKAEAKAELTHTRSE